MIVAEQKAIQDILAMLPEVEQLLVLGCDTCVTVCMAGGEKEVKLVCGAIRLAEVKIGSVRGMSVERQCDKEFLADIAAEVEAADVVLSLACGAGVQMLAETYPDKVVLPGLNTLFMGSNEGAGTWLERCVGCGECMLDVTAGICPKARCSKGLMNGPCGGSQDGKCEVDPENLDCAWNLIYTKLKRVGLLDRMMENRPPRDWSKAHDGGPRRVIREDARL
jgi:ferredoxin